MLSVLSSILCALSNCIGIVILVVPTNPQMKADKKEGVGTYCFIPHSGLRITFDTDKTTAHTKGYVRAQ